MIAMLNSAFAGLANVTPALALLALVFHMGNFVFRSLAWRNVLSAAYPGEKVPLPRIAGAYLSGVAVNAFTPARAGDLVKIGLARAAVKDSSAPTIASSIAVVTAFDTVVGVLAVAAMLALGIFPSIVMPSLPAMAPLLSVLTSHLLVTIPVAAVLGVAGVYVARHLTGRLRKLVRTFVAGFAVLRSPRRYFQNVVPFQAAAWSCRITASYFLLAAFHLPASIGAAVAVVVVGGVATMVPTPGGIGAQQVLLAYVLQATASTVSVVSFSLASQAAITMINTSIGVTALMIMFGTLRPWAAVRHGVRFSRAEA